MHCCAGIIRKIQSSGLQSTSLSNLHDAYICHETICLHTVSFHILRRKTEEKKGLAQIPSILGARVANLGGR